jgi:tellurite resistance protein TerC
MDNYTFLWVVFAAMASSLLFLDLLMHRRRGENSEPSLRASSFETMGWVAAALVFGALVFNFLGLQKFLEYMTGYVVELSLSMDNVFVFALIFKYFHIPIKYQHRVLFLGVVGAVVMRLLMITFGIFLIQKFEWIFLFFGLFLIFSAYKIVVANEEDGIKEDGKFVKYLSKFINFTPKLHGERFIIIQNGKRFFTPLFLVLLLIEKTDLVFALDSIPAILAITQDPLIVFSSNIFAILGLRSLYFLLAQVMHMFIYLKYGLAFVLSFIGAKMIFLYFNIHMPTTISLGVITSALAISIVASLFANKGITKA